MIIKEYKDFYLLSLGGKQLYVKCGNSVYWKTTTNKERFEKYVDRLIANINKWNSK